MLFCSFCYRSVVLKSISMRISQSQERHHQRSGHYSVMMSHALLKNVNPFLEMLRKKTERNSVLYIYIFYQVNCIENQRRCIFLKSKFCPWPFDCSTGRQWKSTDFFISSMTFYLQKYTFAREPAEYIGMNI